MIYNIFENRYELILLLVIQRALADQRSIFDFWHRTYVEVVYRKWHALTVYESFARVEIMVRRIRILQSILLPLGLLQQLVGDDVLAQGSPE